MPMEGIVALISKLPSEKGSINFSYHGLERARFRDTFPFLNATQTGSKNGISPSVPAYDQVCTEWNEEEEQFARHGAYELHKKLFKTKGHHRDVHKTTF